MLKLVQNNIPHFTTYHRIIPAGDIDIFYALGAGEFGLVQKGVWKYKGQKVG